MLCTFISPPVFFLCGIFFRQSNFRVAFCPVALCLGFGLESSLPSEDGDVSLRRLRSPSRCRRRSPSPDDDRVCVACLRFFHPYRWWERQSQGSYSLNPWRLSVLVFLSDGLLCLSSIWTDARLWTDSVLPLGWELCLSSPRVRPLSRTKLKPLMLEVSGSHCFLLFYQCEINSQTFVVSFGSLLWLITVSCQWRMKPC